MKKHLIAVLMVLMVVALCFAQTTPSTEFEDTGRKPVRKIPVREGNFEIIQGRRVSPPIDMERFAEAAYTSIVTLNIGGPGEVTVLQEGTGFIYFRIRRPPAWVEVKLCYWEDEYWYEYVESYRHNADPRANRIHRNYNTYIERIDESLRRGYQ